MLYTRKIPQVVLEHGVLCWEKTYDWFLESLRISREKDDRYSEDVIYVSDFMIYTSATMIYRVMKKI